MKGPIERAAGDALIESLSEELKQELRAGLADGLTPREIVDDSRDICLLHGKKGASLLLAIYAFLEREMLQAN